MACVSKHHLLARFAYGFLILHVGILVSTLQASRLNAESGRWAFVSLLRERRIVTYERERQTGRLVRRGETNCPSEPAIMCASKDGRLLFVSFRSSGQLASFKIDGKTGGLTLLSIVKGGDDPAYLLPDQTGRFLFSAYYQANKVMVHAIQPNGVIEPIALQSLKTAKNAHGIAIDRRNAIVLVSHTGGNSIFQFRFDSKRGKLTPSDPPLLTAAAGEHPRHIEIHPSNLWAYSNNEAGDSLSVYALDGQQARLTPLQTLSTLPAGRDGTNNSTARCAMTADGGFIYVANRGHNSIAAFSIDSMNGTIKSLGQFMTEKTPRSFCIDRQGKFLYVAGQDSGRIAAYRLDGQGKLMKAGVVEPGPIPWCVLAVDSKSD